MAIIHIDSAERRQDYIHIFSSLGHEVRVGMFIADYSFETLIGVERKTVPDLLNSIREGKVFDQLDKVAQVFQQAFLVIDDAPQALEEIFSRFGMKQFEGFCASALEHHGCIVAFSWGRLPYWLDAHIRKATDGKMADPENRANPVRITRGDKVLASADITANVLAQLPGVSLREARRHSHLDLITAIQSVKGKVRLHYREQIKEGGTNDN